MSNKPNGLDKLGKHLCEANALLGRILSAIQQLDEPQTTGERIAASAVLVEDGALVARGSNGEEAVFPPAPGYECLHHANRERLTKVIAGLIDRGIEVARAGDLKRTIAGVALYADTANQEKLDYIKGVLDTAMRTKEMHNERMGFAPDKDLTRWFELAWQDGRK